MATESGGDETGDPGDEIGDKTTADERDGGDRWGNVCGRRSVYKQSTSDIFVWRALRNFAMADFEENVEEMMGTTRERRVATDSGGDETGGPGDDTGDKTAATAGDE